MLIDCSYFTKGSRHIQNAATGAIPNPNTHEVCDLIESYIDECQERFLVKMLGSVLGHRINAYLLSRENDERIMSEPFDTVCGRLRESFADYVFFHILGVSATQATVKGLLKIKCANEYVVPITRQVPVWNSMVDKNRIFAEWCASGGCPIANVDISDEMLTKINKLNL